MSAKIISYPGKKAKKPLGNKTKPKSDGKLGFAGGPNDGSAQGKLIDAIYRALNMKHGGATTEEIADRATKLAARSGRTVTPGLVTKILGAVNTVAETDRDYFGWIAPHSKPGPVSANEHEQVRHHAELIGRAARDGFAHPHHFQTTVEGLLADIRHIVTRGIHADVICQNLKTKLKEYCTKQQWILLSPVLTSLHMIAETGKDAREALKEIKPGAAWNGTNGA